MLRKLPTLLLTTIAVLILASPTLAGKYNKALEIGDGAPSWENLKGVDDKEHSLDDYKAAKVLVVVFTCNSCPVAVAYEDRLIALQKDYQDKEVQLVAINVNNIPPDRLEKMKERAASKDFNFPYLYDASQSSAKEYGARVTPDVVVLDQDRNVVYLGAIDDNMKADKVTKHYLRDALDALLAGKTPATTETNAFGCGIKWDK